jgi:hypothetical protein
LSAGLSQICFERGAIHTMQNSKEATAFWIARPGSGELRSSVLPSLKVEEIRVRALYSAISMGTERIVFSGQVPMSEYATMKAPFQEGEFSGAVKYGYSSCGVVEEGPPELMGKIVFSLYPHQDNYVLPRDAVHVVPVGVPPERAILAANMETALNALWDVAPCLGARIAVVGAGVVGCLAAYLCSRVPGTDVVMVDINPERQAVADALDLKFGSDVASGSMDLVIHASGTSSGLETALNLAGFEATVLELSWYGNKPAIAHLGSAFHSRRVTLRSSQVGSVGILQRARWSRAKRLGLALRFLSDDTLDCLVSGESNFCCLPATMDRLMSRSYSELCHRVVYPS